MPIWEPIIQQKSFWSSAAPINKVVQTLCYSCYHSNLTSLLMIFSGCVHGPAEWVHLNWCLAGACSSYIQSQFNFYSYLQEPKLSIIDYFLMLLRLKSERKGVCCLSELFIPSAISPPLEMLNGQHQRKGENSWGSSLSNWTSKFSLM